MLKHRQMPIEVHPLPRLTLEPDLIGDRCQAIWEYGELQLRHPLSLSESPPLQQLPDSFPFPHFFISARKWVTHFWRSETLSTQGLRSLLPVLATLPGFDQPTVDRAKPVGLAR